MDRSEICIGCPGADLTTPVGVPGGGITGPVVAGTGDIGTDGTGTGDIGTDGTGTDGTGTDGADTDGADTDGTLSGWTAPGGGIGPEASASSEVPAGGWPAIASYCAPSDGGNDGELMAVGDGADWAG